jgi:L-arabinose isomerase
MLKPVKPRIGIHALMQGLYDESQPEIPANQTKFINDVIARLSNAAEFIFPGLAKEKVDTDRIVKSFNDQDLDGILLINALYSPGLRIVQAYKNNNLPVLLANIQPLPEVTMDWNWSYLTTNQGIHGIQDTANMLMRLGYEPAIITEDWQSDAFYTFVADWVAAAATAKRLTKVRLALMQKMQNMGDILGDEVAFYQKFGIEVLHEGIGQVVAAMADVTDAEIDAQIAEDYKNFEVEKNLPEKNHRYAAKLQLAFEKFLAKKGYDGFSANFMVYEEDGRLEQLPILGACNMMAKGYAYSAEGDVHILALMAMGHLLIGNPHFTEMYSLDFKRDACMFAHMGEGNWKVARPDRPVVLIDRPLDIGNKDNPPTPIFSAALGVTTVASLVPVTGDYYRLVAMRGTVLDTPRIFGIPMNHTFFKPDNGIKEAMDNWLKYGGTHHQVLWTGDHMAKLEKLAKIIGIEFIDVSR